MNSDKEIVILIGPPGAGKGTLAQLCLHRMGWVQCSTGDLCRKHIAEKTTIGSQIDLFIKSGKLISDELIIEMVEEWLVKNLNSCNKIIFDGFPRTLIQAELLESLLRKSSFKNISVSIVKMELDNETVVKRLSSRLICQNSVCCAVYSVAALDKAQDSLRCTECSSRLVRRSDDVEEVVRDRIAMYHVHAHELLIYYQSLGRKIDNISVLQPIEQVFDQFVTLMNCKTA